MKPTKPFLIAVAGAGALALLLLAGCGGGGTDNSSAGRPAATNGPVLANHPFTIAITRAFEHVSGPNMAVQPGVPVRVTIVNYTHRAHTLTAPALGVSVFIRATTMHAASRTTFTLTANKYGVFRWYCVLPCGGDMSGHIYAIIE